MKSFSPVIIIMTLVLGLTKIEAYAHIPTVIVSSDLMSSTDPDNETIMVNSAYIDGKVRLRWMATEMKVWEHGMKVGYTIERITVFDGTNYLTKAERMQSYVVLEEAYLPKSQAEMEAATTNPNEGTLANLLMNEQSTQDSIMTANQNGNSLASAIKQKEMRDNRFFYSHVLAEKSFELACAMGMAYEDDTIESDKEYAYLITLTEPLNQ